MHIFFFGLFLGLTVACVNFVWDSVLRSRAQAKIRVLEIARRNLEWELKRTNALLTFTPEISEAFVAIGNVAEHCYRTARDKGWWDEYTVTSDGGLPSASSVTTALELNADQLAARLCLIHSEVSEALEDVRAGSPLDVSMVSPVDGKPIGFPSELADVVIRVFDLTSHMGINIGEEMAKKMAFNTTRPHRHGGKAL